MKKIFSMLLSAFMMFSLAACGQGNSQGEATQGSTENCKPY